MVQGNRFHSESAFINSSEIFRKNTDPVSFMSAFIMMCIFSPQKPIATAQAKISLLQQQDFPGIPR